MIDYRSTSEMTFALILISNTSLINMTLNSVGEFKFC